MANMSFSTASMPPSPQSPLDAACDALSGAIARLADAAAAGRDKVHPVLAPSMPAQCGGKDACVQSVAPASSLMVESMHVERRRVEEVTAMLSDVLQRLEV